MNTYRFPTPSAHPDWLPPHTLEWYAQMGAADGRYAYSWNSVITEPSSETIFTEEIAAHAAGKTILDVGCGHGEFTRSWAGVAREVTGLDVTDGFLQSDNPPNVRFVSANAKQGLPFADRTFDLVYCRRGPTSWFYDAGRVVQPGGLVLSMHPGDDHQHELPALFPGLFAEAPAGTPILDNLRERVAKSGLADITIETLRTTEYLASPEDVLLIACFGQKDTMLFDVKKACHAQVASLFRQHATPQGLPVTHSRYLIRARGQ